MPVNPMGGHSEIRNVSFRPAAKSPLAGQTIDSVDEDPVIYTGHSPPIAHGFTGAGGGPSFAGDYYVGFDWKCDANGCDRSLNGFVTYPPDLMDFVGYSSFYGWEGQGLEMHRIGTGNTYNFQVAFSNTSPSYFGPTIVGGTSYHLDVFYDGIDFITVKIDGTTYGPFNYTGTFDSDGFPNPWFTRLEVGGTEYGGVNSNYKGKWTYDNVTVGTTGYGSSDLFSSDFSTALPSGFDLEQDAGSVLTLVGGAMQIDWPGGGASLKAYLRKEF